MKYMQALMSERNSVLSLVVHWCRKYGVREWLQLLSSGKRRQMLEEWRTLNFWRKSKREGKQLRKQQRHRLHPQREALGYACMHDVCVLHCIHHIGTFVGRGPSMGGHLQQSVACMLLCSYDNRNTITIVTICYTTSRPFLHLVYPHACTGLVIVIREKSRLFYRSMDFQSRITPLPLPYSSAGTDLLVRSGLLCVSPASGGE